MKFFYQNTTLTPGALYLIPKAILFSLFALGIRTVHRYLLARPLDDSSLPLPHNMLWTVIFLVSYKALRVQFTELQNKRNAASRGARLVPVIRGRWIGNLDVMSKIADMLRKGYPGDYLYDIEAELGPIFNSRGLWEDLIFTSSPEYIKRMLATDFDNFIKGERFQHMAHSLLGVGVFNADGEMWKFHRRLTRPFFSREKITHFELFDRHADIVIESLKKRLRSGHSVDFQDLMGRFTLDAATNFLFGICSNTLQDALPYPYSHRQSMNQKDIAGTQSSEFIDAFIDAQYQTAGRVNAASFWPLLELFEDKTAKPMLIVRKFVEPIVEKALEKKRKRGPASSHVNMESEDESEEFIEIGDDDTLLDHLVKVTDDPIIVRDEIFNIMIAGRDTTSGTLTFVMHFLCLYPDICTRLRQEILGKIGSWKRPTIEDVREMRYLRAVINETLRLYPVVPFDLRSSVEAATWPSDDPSQPPIYIPPNTQIIYSVFMMHRRKDLWGPDAEEFDPDRWLDERVKKYLTPNPFIFLPFNAGPRICLGQQFAYNEISFMIIRLLQSFTSFTLDTDPGLLSPNSPDRRPKEWENCPGRKGMDRFYPKKTLTLCAAGGLWIKASEVETVEL
ncbi:hypothetical protein GYMLUDRAFT_50586 [Collybiopsis luxurians FD-317 M1]|uniref:Cytochrome P450 n=1 Tax=Collybiopsis luxurians FD-317 M1 TaxID=944289 RepID=A0A0D0C959_9AGAR|nr:hypothetical protein GYMLUDRAFT_50586 [Collybiopsis luxurians FD-317 M1]